MFLLFLDPHTLLAMTSEKVKSLRHLQDDIWCYWINLDCRALLAMTSEKVNSLRHPQWYEVNVRIQEVLKKIKWKNMNKDFN